MVSHRPPEPPRRAPGSLAAWKNTSVASWLLSPRPGRCGVSVGWFHAPCHSVARSQPRWEPRRSRREGSGNHELVNHGSASLRTQSWLPPSTSPAPGLWDGKHEADLRESQKAFQVPLPDLTVALLCWLPCSRRGRGRGLRGAVPLLQG